MSISSGAAIAQIIELATGSAPTASQVAAWENYESASGSIASISCAFVESTSFANAYNNGSPVDLSSAVGHGIAQGIVEHALGFATEAQVSAWVDTGLSVPSVFLAFALGDQFTASEASQNARFAPSETPVSPTTSLTGSAPFIDTGQLTGGTTSSGATTSDILMPTLLAAASGDQIVFNNAENESLANLGGGASEMSVNSVFSLAQALDLATADATASGSGFWLPAQSGLIDWFQFGGDTYIVEAINPTASPEEQTALSSTDAVIKLAGLVDLSGAQFANHTLTI
jgi:hypothetical protein